jgi:hypothetical protein
MGRTDSPNLKNDYERAGGWFMPFQSERNGALSECTDRYAQKLLDTADIVREAILRQRKEGLCLLGLVRSIVDFPLQRNPQFLVRFALEEAGKYCASGT